MIVMGMKLYFELTFVILTDEQDLLFYEKPLQSRRYNEKYICLM